MNKSHEQQPPAATNATNNTTRIAECSTQAAGVIIVEEGPADWLNVGRNSSQPMSGGLNIAETLIVNQKKAESAKSNGVAGNPLIPQPETIFVGTKLKVRVFERADLSGEFRVRDNGSVSIPFLGSFYVAGCDELGLENELAASFSQLAGRKGSVSVEVIGQKPIFVTGEVSKPGAYPFISGMTVMHGVSVAGGFFRPSAWGTGLTLEATREEGRARVSSYKIGRLLARLSRLVAEKNGLTNVGRLTNADPSTDLVNTIGRDAARALMVSENEILQQRMQLIARKLEDFRQSEELARREMKSLEEQIRSIDVQLELYRGQLGLMKELAVKGLARGITMLELKTSAARLEAEKRSVRASLARAEQALTSVQSEAANFLPDRRLEITNEISAIEKQIREQRESLRSSHKVIRQVSGLKTDSFGRPTQPNYQYTITRRNDKSNVAITAGQTTTLKPGDVLNVTLDRLSANFGLPLAADANRPKLKYKAKISVPVVGGVPIVPAP